MSSPIARITSDKKLKLKGNKFSIWSSFEDSQNLDDTYQLEETYQFDDTLEIDTFVNYILNSTVTPTTVDKFAFDYQGNLIVPEAYTIWQGFDSVESIDSANINWDTTYSIDFTLGIESLLSYMFSLDILDIPIDKFKILNDKTLLCNELLESQIL